MNKMISAIAGIALAASLGTAFAGNTSSLKIGVVDLPMILQKSPQVASINEKLKGEFSSQQKTVMELQNKLRGEIAKISDQGSAKLTADEKKKLQEQISGDQKELQQQVVKLQDSLAQAQASEMQKFMNEIDKASSTVANKQGYDIVLLKQAVLYPQATDITKDIISEMPKK